MSSLKSKNTAPYILATSLNVKTKLRHQRHDFRNQFIHLFTKYKKSDIKKVNDFYLVKNIDLSIKSGDRIGVLGKNGTGKTSLLKIISRLIPPTSGSISIHGDVRAVFTPSIDIFPELSARENLQLLSKIYYPLMPKSSRLEILEECIDFSELNHFIDSPIKFFSKGMKTRLFLTLISAVPTDIVLLDEAYDGVDQHFTRKLNHRMNAFLDQSKIVILVSHSTQEISRLCNRAIVMGQGEIIHQGTPQESLEFYQSLDKIDSLSTKYTFN